VSHLGVHWRDTQDGSGKTLWGSYVCATLKAGDVHRRWWKRRARTRDYTTDRSKVTCAVCLRLTRLP
jgi:hypothetical protein